MDSFSTKYIHYSRTPLEKLNPCSYIQTVNTKPSGLWLSAEGPKVDMNWKDWCLSEDFHLENLTYRHEVKLNRDHILRLYDRNDILYFTKEYGVHSGTNINWKKLPKFYKGIIISPYAWNARFDSKCFWYYVWDCACGCIWDLSAIEKFTLLPIDQSTEHRYIL